MIETSQLHTLVTVASNDSFSKAAEKLGVTQSAISQSIKNLENKIGVKLFKRFGKKVAMTPEGEKLFALGSDFFSRLDETVEQIRYDKDSMSGKVRIGTLTGIGKSWLGYEMLSLSRDFSRINVEVKLGFEEHLIRDFEGHKLDFVVMPESALPRTREKIYLNEEKLAMVYPRENNFGIDSKVTAEKLCTVPTILFENNDLLYSKWCMECFGDVPSKINVRFIINSHGKMLEAVHQGLGVAVIPTHVLKRSYYRDKISVLGRKFEVSNGKFYLVHHKGATEFVRIKKTIDRLVGSKKPL